LCLDRRLQLTEDVELAPEGLGHARRQLVPLLPIRHVAHAALRHVIQQTCTLEQMCSCGTVQSSRWRWTTRQRLLKCIPARRKCHCQALLRGQPAAQPRARLMPWMQCMTIMQARRVYMHWAAVGVPGPAAASPAVPGATSVLPARPDPRPSTLRACFRGPQLCVRTRRPGKGGTRPSRKGGVCSAELERTGRTFEALAQRPRWVKAPEPLLQTSCMFVCLRRCVHTTPVATTATRLQRPTRAPNRASSSTTAAPMPFVAPVTSAV
jgi:hypothetical protein